MNHLTRVLENMTNAIEHFGIRWKRKVSKLLMALLQNTNLEMLLRSSAAVANVGLASGGGHGGTGTWLDNRVC